MATTSHEIWVCGEVLIDLIPEPGGSEKRAIVGGGPANTAKALARLGFDTYFIDGISTDTYGQMCASELRDDGVNLSYAHFVDKPTCTADVTLDADGGAHYIFTIDGTATFDFSDTWLPDPTLSPAVLHIGTLVTIIEPAATVLFQWATKVAEKSTIVFDPNIRPTVEGNRDKYRAAVERWAAISDVIKVSDDDLLWLYPNVDPITVAKRWISEGRSLVVITKGAAGLTGLTAGELVDVPGVMVTVSDTVGAGDTVGAIVVEGIVENGVENLRGDLLRKNLELAAKAAAITCSRPGAQPPTRAELE